MQLFETVARARNADAVVVGIYATGWTAGLAAAAEKVLDMDKPVVALLANAPYLAAALPRKLRALACTFCAGPAQFCVFTDWLAGELVPTGRMPVRL
jgi:beta-N-acetylhexosaminidase